MLADDDQRQALVAFVDEVLGGADASKDPRGLTWLPVFERTGAAVGPDVTVFVVLDDQHVDHVRIGVGVAVQASDQIASVRSHIPLFRAAKQGHPPASDPVILGTADGVISIDLAVTIDDPLIRGVQLIADVPTGGDAPTIGVRLLGLQLPGDAAPHDVELSVHDLEELEATVLQLVLTLVKAGVAATGSGPLGSLAGMLGLRGASSVPPLPVPDLVERGVPALTEWFEEVMHGDGSRAAWLAELAALLAPLGGTADAQAVTFDLGPARVQVGVRVTSGTGGHPQIVPFLRTAVGAVAGDAVASISADLAVIDFGPPEPSATALPACAVAGVLGKRADGHGNALLQGDPAVDRLVFGFGLDAQRRPTLTLAAEHVTIDGIVHDVIDLSSPDAVAQAAGTVLDAVLEEVLAGLGPALDAIKTLLGLTPPPGFPTIATTDLATFLRDPLGAVAAYWASVLATHTDAVPAVLDVLLRLIADASQAGAAITGTGTTADPWVVPVVTPVGLRAWVDDGVLTLAVGALLEVDTLGQGCTRLTTTISAALCSLDLAARHVVFIPEVLASLGAVAVETDQARIDIGPLSMRASRIGLQAAWHPVGGLAVNVLAPDLTVETSGFSVPVALPVIGADGSISLDDAGWDAVEGLLGALASAAPVGLVRDLAKVLGWRLRGPGEIGADVRLRLADVHNDPAAAITGWLGRLALEDAPELARLLRPLARSFTGSVTDSGALEGIGTPSDPWFVGLLHEPSSPGLAAWIEPAGPGLVPVSGPVPIAVNADVAGLPSAALVRAMTDLASADPLVAALLSDRATLTDGIDALVTRWTGSDGVVIPPPGSVAGDPDPAVVPGIVVHRLPGLLADELAGAVRLDDLLGRTPATTVRVSVGDASWLVGAPADRVVRLDAAGLPPEGFDAPVAATGDWYVVLADRAGARLVSDDPDGVGGQAARLARVLEALGTADNSIAVVATASAGHAAARGAASVDAVTDVVTLGTPWSEVTLSVLDVGPAAEAVRALAALDRAGAAPPTAGLARARALLASVAGLVASDDPVREIRMPGGPVPARDGMRVHAVFGEASEDIVRALLSDLVLAAVEARKELVTTAPAPPTALRAGVRVPLATSSPSGVSVSGHLTVELGGVGAGSSGVGVLTDGRAVRVHLELRRPGGWLVGGPDPGRAPGSLHDVDLRWLEADMCVPTSAGIDVSNARATAQIVLHEPRVLGQARARWVVRTTGPIDAVSTVDEVTPALPEVRVVMSALTEALATSATADPQLTAALDGLKAVGLLDAAGGSVPDALDHLLHDPVAFSATATVDAARRGALAAALRALLSGSGASEVATWTVGGATISLDLAARSLVVDASGTGAVPWTAHAALDVAAARPQVRLELGSPGSTPAGGGLLLLTTSPSSQVRFEWHAPGALTPVDIRLWPDPDLSAALPLLVRMLPAELGRQGLEYLRRLDPDVRPIADAALDAIGLLAVAPLGDGVRPVRLPLGLITNPVGWFKHGGALGGSSGFDPGRVISFLDALKPILGVSGAPGHWDVATGVGIVASDSNGRTRLVLELATQELTPIPPDDETLEVTAVAGVVLSAEGPPDVLLEVAVGLPGASAPGTKALHVALGSTDGVTVFVRPPTGPDISLYPHSPGLGSIASAATHALPFVLNALADETGNDLAGKAGEVVRAIGDAMALRSGAPAAFHDAELQAWAADPGGRLAARLPALAVGVLQALRDAVEPALPTGVTMAVTNGELVVTSATLTVGLTPNPFAVRVLAEPTGLPGIERARVEAVADGTGLRVLDVTVGPGALDVVGAELRPYARITAGTAPTDGRRVEIGLGLTDDGARRFAVRWNLGGAFDLVAIDGVTQVTAATDPPAIAAVVVEAVVDLAGGIVVGTSAVQALLERSCGAAKIGDVLDGVLVQPDAGGWRLVGGVFELDTALARLQQLALNLVRVARPRLDLAELSLELVESPPGTLGAQLIPKARYALGGDDVTIALEFDSSWLDKTPTPDPGLLLRLLHVGAAPGDFTFTPGIEVDGIGIRVARSSGPLLDLSEVTIASVAVHTYGEVGVGTGIGGGIQLQLSDLAVGTAGASGGGNGVAQGVMKDAGSGSNKLAPRFSPAVSVQKTPGSTDVLVGLRAGDPPGPWWLAIQKGFGPVYIEQVGFDARVEQQHLQSISLLLDGRVSIFGLTAAVDDLSAHLRGRVGPLVLRPGPLGRRPGGICDQLRPRRPDACGRPAQVRRARPARPTRDDPVHRDAVGALRGLRTVGVRRLRHRPRARRPRVRKLLRVRSGQRPDRRPTGVLPHRHRRRPRHQPRPRLPHRSEQLRLVPLHQRAGPRRHAAIRPDGSAAAVRATRSRSRPASSGSPPGSASTASRSSTGLRSSQCRLATGSSSRCSGLARMALPRPQLALVSIELGLICRFSTKEGVLWIQAQLTDNSWLLFPEIRLTGGFAFVSWFKGAVSRPVRAHDGRLPPRLPPRRVPGRAPPRLQRRPRLHQHQGRELLRAHVRGPDGRGQAGGVSGPGPGVGPRGVRRRRDRVLRPVLDGREGLRTDLGRDHHRPLVRDHHDLGQPRSTDPRVRPQVPRRGHLRDRSGGPDCQLRRQRQ